MTQAQTIKTIQSLIDQGVSAYHIAQLLKLEGVKVYCYGSYYTSRRVSFYQTTDGTVKCGTI